MIRILIFLLLSTPLMAQTDSLHYDKWIGWVTPLSIYHRYHSAIEVGAEYNPGKQLAYTLSYEIQVPTKRSNLFNNQDHQYLRLGVKKISGQETDLRLCHGRAWPVSHCSQWIYRILGR